MRGSRVLVALVMIGLAGALPADAGAQQTAPPATPVVARGPRSTLGMIQMVKAGPVVLGEQFEVRLYPPAAGDTTWGHLEWGVPSNKPWPEKEKEPALPSTYPVSVSDAFTSDFDLRKFPLGFPATATAPYDHPGRFELRLLHGNQLVDTLEIDVVVGTAPPPKPYKKVYTVGEPIEYEVTLPPNRFYSHDWSGPATMLYPLEQRGQRLTPEQAKAWMATCDCQTWLLGLTKKVDAGALDPTIKPGTYQVTQAEAKAGLIAHPLVAPDIPGRYELRLYDRGYDNDFASYVDMPLSSTEIVVEEPGTSPISLRFVRMTTPAAPASGRGGSAASAPVVQALNELTHGEVFYIEARFAQVPGVTEPTERWVTLEWVDKGAQQSRNIRLTRQSEGLYLSIPLVLAKPGGQ
jgi:hypothetical protein